MSKIPFNVHAYTARLIGRENVSKLEGAVLELVKNTYDADASICILYYENSTSTLYIADNGSGMTEDTIISHWMTIGNSSKIKDYKTPKGRIQTGAKGIGRFALDRISDVCKMLTVTEETKLEWNVNWSDFDAGTTITEIYASLESVDYTIEDFFNTVNNTFLKKIISEKFKTIGTVFKLNSLRDEWSGALVENIRNNLATLIPPEIENIFKVYFFCEDTTEEKARVSLKDGLFSYDYKIDFKVGLDGQLETKIFRNEFDFKDQFEKIMAEAGFIQEDREYFRGKPKIFKNMLYEMLPSEKSQISNKIGKFAGTLYFSKLAAPKAEKEKYYYKDFSDRKDFRDTFGGIKIYRDNFRVRPYGEPKTSNYDWLLLSNRKAKSPAAISSTGKWRVNSDQILGSLHISRTNLTLPDQANREGIVETKEFIQLREIMLGVIRLFEEDRQYVIRKLSKYYDQTHYTEQIEQEIFSRADKEEKNNKKGKDKNENTPPEYIEISKVKTVIENKDNLIRDLEDENRLLRALATTGIVTNTYIHEIKDSTHKLSMKIVMAKEALELDDDKVEAIEYINAANDIKESFNSWFKVTIESVRRDKRTMKTIDLQKLLSELITSWNDVVNNKGIQVNLEMNEIYFKCFPFEIESLINNLITNSITAFEGFRSENKEILIKVIQNNLGIVIEYQDNGLGLSPAYKNNPERILEPFESAKRNEMDELIGTGMGMWVIDKTVSEYNGTIDLSQNKVSDKGFYIKITLKIKK